MSLLVVSDLHAHAWPRFSTTLADGTNSRFQDLLNVLDQVEWAVDKYQPEHLFILGDLTHQRFFVRFSVFNRIAAWLAKMAGKVTVSVLAGNHDIEGEGVNSLQALRYMGINVFDEPQWMDLAMGPTYLVPYMHHGVAAAMENPPPMGRRGFPAGAMLHYALDGKVLDSEYRLPSPLGFAQTGEFPRLWLGHVHSPSTEYDGMVTYVGAPMHFDFGDQGERFCWLVDDNGISYPIKLSAPEFATASYPRIGSPAQAKRHFLRVLNVPRKLFADVKQSALDLGWADVICVEQAIPTEAVRLVTTGAVINDALIRDYIVKTYPDLDEPTKLRVIEAGLSYLRKAEHPG